MRNTRGLFDEWKEASVVRRESRKHGRRTIGDGI